MGSLTLPELESYDAFQLSLNSLSGVDSKIMLSTQELNEILQTTGTVSFDDADSSLSNNPFLYDVKSSVGVAKVDPTTLRYAPWLSTNERKVGRLMCELVPVANQSASSFSPRAAAMAQVERLREEFGLTMISAFEMEFLVFEEDGITPVDKSTFKAYGRIDIWNKNRRAALDACHSLEKAGLPFESIAIESQSVQLEMTFQPQEGVASADTVVMTKEGLRCELGKHTLKPTFMVKPVPYESTSTFHFNHSLWTMDKTNAFRDLSAPDYLTPLARHWMAGLIEHAPALTALLCPTVSCLEGLNIHLTPTYATWGPDDRRAFIRLKKQRDNIYMENRLASSSCNPYLNVAATMAAGMDGLARKLECPPKNDPKAKRIPRTMEEAIACLEADDILIKALGEDLVNAFLAISKRSVDPKAKEDLKELDYRRKMYFHI